MTEYILITIMSSFGFLMIGFALGYSSNKDRIKRDDEERKKIWPPEPCENYHHCKMSGKYPHLDVDGTFWRDCKRNYNCINR